MVNCGSCVHAHKSLDEEPCNICDISSIEHSWHEIDENLYDEQ